MTPPTISVFNLPERLSAKADPNLIGDDERFSEVEELARRSLSIREAALGKLHPLVASSLNNLAVLYRTQGEYAKAEPLLRRALEMREKLYSKAAFPLGHPDLASSINSLAFLHKDQGEYGKAEPLLRRALEMYGATAAALAGTAPEATAMNYLASLPLARDGFLSATRELPGTDAYQAVWQSKAALSRLYQRRHLAVLAAASPQWRALHLVLRRHGQGADPGRGDEHPGGRQVPGGFEGEQGFVRLRLADALPAGAAERKCDFRQLPRRAGESATRRSDAGQKSRLDVQGFQTVRE